MQAISFSDFESQRRAEGFDEVLPREWAPNSAVATHTHPFEVKALVISGDLWLTCGDETRHLRAGDCFELPREFPHSERYGPEGATFWAARRHAT